MDNKKQQLYSSPRFFVYGCLFLVLVPLSLTRLVIFTRQAFIVIAGSSGVDLKINTTTDDVNGENKERSHSIVNSTNIIKEEYNDFLTNTWPSVRHVLCGRGSPNLMLSRLLFKLAREEVFRENDPEILNTTFKNIHGGPTDTLTAFFVGNWGTSIYKDAQNLHLTTVYIRIWKCANNQIRWMEKKLARQRKGTYIPSGNFHSLSQYIHARNNINKTHSYDSLTDDEIVQPCFYTAIRDPLTHFLSGFNEVEVRTLGEYNNGTTKYNMTSHIAPYHKNVPYSNSSKTLRKQRFTAFVKDLLLEDDIFSTHYQYSHFFSMSRVLSVLSKYNISLTGYIPTITNITSTWPAFIASTCKNAPTVDKIPKMTIQGQHRSSNDRLQMYQAARDVWNEGGPIARSLCLLHAYDYACWEHLPEGIPRTCSDVYKKHARLLTDYGLKHYYNYMY